METQENNSWGLFYNGNGEWISETKVVFLFESLAAKLKTHADEQGIKFIIHKTCFGELWCYRVEIEAINPRYLKKTIKEWKLLVNQNVNV